MKYKIKIDYITGNSFGSGDTSSIIELEWNDLNVAKANLKRIQDHWDYYTAKEGRCWWSREKEAKELTIKVEAEKPDWLVVDYPETHESMLHCLIRLYTDNGKVFQTWPPYVGYFESLTSAEIVSEDSDMKFITKY